MRSHLIAEMNPYLRTFDSSIRRSSFEQNIFDGRKGIKVTKTKRRRDCEYVDGAAVGLHSRHAKDGEDA